MPFFYRLTAIALTAILIVPAVPLEAKTRKGDKYYAEGAKAEAKKDWDAALQNYDKALAEDPNEIVYQIAATRARSQDAQMHVDNGLKTRAEGNLAQALLEFQRAYSLGTGNAIAEQEIRFTQEMIERERQRQQQTGKESPPEVRALTPQDELKQETKEKIDRMLPPPELQPLNPQPLKELKLNNQTPRVLFETVARVAGINVIFDPDYQPGKNQSIDLSNSTVEEALNDIALVTKSFWTPISANTIFVANDNRNKRQDYEEQVLKVFYLQNVGTAQELQEIVNAVRAVTELTRLMPYNEQNAIIARGEADRVALAEKIIHALDKPKPEVVIDVIVLQASDVFSKQITAALAGGTGLNIPVVFNPRSTIQAQQSTTSTTTPATTATGTTATSTTSSTASLGSTTTPFIPLNNLGHLSSADFAMTLPGALLQAALSDATTKILQTPQVRAVSGFKADMKIGERIPTATGSFQPGVGGVGINPLVNTQFQYIDVGVNVTVLPIVHDNGEISMHVDLDISSEAGTVNLGGINQPIIQQNKISHDLRVREGEVSLLAGLVQDQDNKTVTGIPGLSSIPLLGKLFSGYSWNTNKSNIMMALVPHIVRQPEMEADDLRTIAVGNSTTVKLNYAPRVVETAQQAAPTAAPPNPAPAAPVPALLPGAPLPGAALPPNQAPAGAVHAFFQPGQVNTSASATFSVALAVNGAADVASAPMQIQFDPKLLRLNGVMLGDLFTQAGQQPSFTQNILNDSGTATIQLNRAAGTPGISGNGVLVNLNFQAVGRGVTNVTVSNLTLANSKGQPLSAGSPQLNVTVK
jgi:general secretion pathway protein D